MFPSCRILEGEPFAWKSNSHLLSRYTAPPTPLSPLTAWGQELEDATAAQESSRKANYEFPRVINKSDLGDINDELLWVKDNAHDIKDSMVLNGAVVFRGWETMKTQPGFVKVRKQRLRKVKNVEQDGNVPWGSGAGCFEYIQ